MLPPDHPALQSAVLPFLCCYFHDAAMDECLNGTQRALTAADDAHGHCLRYSVTELCTAFHLNLGDGPADAEPAPSSAIWPCRPT